MKFICPLVVVNEMKASRSFYENILNQKVQFDFGENVSFESGFAIHLKSHFSNLISISENDILKKSNNFELCFEEEDMDSFLQKLEEISSIEYVHGLKEQPGDRGLSDFTILTNTLLKLASPWKAL